MNRILLLLFLTAFPAFAQVPPVVRNIYSTSAPNAYLSGDILAGGNANVVGAITNAGLTASRAVVSDANKKLISATGTPDGTKFLRDDNSYASVPSGGAFYVFDSTQFITNNVTNVVIKAFWKSTNGLFYSSSVTSSVAVFTSVASPATNIFEVWSNATRIFQINSNSTMQSSAVGAGLALYADANAQILGASSVALTYSANTQTVNFTSSPYQTFQMTNDTVFTNQNQAVARSVAVKMIGNNTNCALSFPSAWVFVGSTAPSSLTSNKTAILSLSAFGTDPTNIVAVYAVQP